MPRASTFQAPRERDALNGFADGFAAWRAGVSMPATVATGFQIAFDELRTNAIAHGAASPEPPLEHVQADAHALDEALKLAASIQMSMVPQAFPKPGTTPIEVHAQLLPAKEVGGDF